jgi:hypothetical protein
MPQASLARADDRLGSVDHLKLAKDVRDMVAHGFLAER